MRPADGQGDLASGLDAGVAAADRHSSARRREIPKPWRSESHAALDDDTHLALVVDQLEEMFSDERISASDRKVCGNRLPHSHAAGACTWSATLRSDVYPRLAELPALIELKEGEGQFDLLPPALREIGQIIRSPAAAAGLRFEVHEHTAERLDDTIRDAAAQNPGALPLLEFLLEELYKLRSSEDVLTFRAYEDLGARGGRARAARGASGCERECRGAERRCLPCSASWSRWARTTTRESCGEMLRAACS